MLELCTPVIYGHAKVADFQAKHLGLNVPLRVVASAEEAADGQVNLVNCSDDEVKVEFGKLSSEAGHAAFLALEQATADVKAGLVDVLVTAPIHKANIQSANFRFPGHTEYLQDRLGTEETSPLMILLNDMMRVALVTTHLPISEVAFAITEERIAEKARLLYESLRRDFNVSAPRIAILALNPHAGDHGVIGQEEEEVIGHVPQVRRSAGHVPRPGARSLQGTLGRRWRELYRRTSLRAHFSRPWHGLRHCWYGHSRRAFHASGYFHGNRCLAQQTALRDGLPKSVAQDLSGTEGTIVPRLCGYFSQSYKG